MTNSEQVDYKTMLRDCKNALFVPEQSVYKMIEVLFCESVLDVWLAIFNHDDTPTFSIESVFFEDVDILHFIVSLGGLSKLTDVVEQALKGGE